MALVSVEPTESELFCSASAFIIIIIAFCIVSHRSSTAVSCRSSRRPNIIVALLCHLAIVGVLTDADVKPSSLGRNESPGVCVMCDTAMQHRKQTYTQRDTDASVEEFSL